MLMETFSKHKLYSNVNIIDEDLNNVAKPLEELKTPFSSKYNKGKCELDCATPNYWSQLNLLKYFTFE